MVSPASQFIRVSNYKVLQYCYVNKLASDELKQSLKLQTVLLLFLCLSMKLKLVKRPLQQPGSYWHNRVSKIPIHAIGDRAQ